MSSALFKTVPLVCLLVLRSVEGIVVMMAVVVWVNQEREEKSIGKRGVVAVVVCRFRCCLLGKIGIAVERVAEM